MQITLANEWFYVLATGFVKLSVVFFYRLLAVGTFTKMHYLHRLGLYSLRGCLYDNIHLYNLFLLSSVLGLLESSRVLLAYI